MRNEKSRFFRLIVLLFNGIWSVPLVFIIRAIRPIVTIKIGTFFSTRIGHFVADTAQQWAANKKNPWNIICLYWLPDNTCNIQWEKMVRRNLFVHSWVYYIDRWNRLLPGGEKHYLPSTCTGSLDINGFLENTGDSFSFLSNEENDAKSWLRSKGWREGNPFVCLMVRDSLYLNQDPLHSNKYDWSYHSYRNSDIHTYSLAIEWLANNGVWVIRMGKIASERMLLSHPMVIDYAFDKGKSDLLDIWLFANCNLCISSGTGPDMISDVYRRPTLFVNFIPVIRLFSWSHSFIYPKHLIWESSGIYLTLSEHLDHSFVSTEEYRMAGIKIINLLPDEILNAVQESWERITGIWINDKDDTKDKEQFWAKLKTSPEYLELHGFIHPESRLLSSFLRDNKFFYK
ncbi:TIGR04372 family glycosyltransferase [bacterium]|jgi:putative glycosyltransferase (TIGR04372 family)|nr:TIGR04372 family glycosyltransferase [bacterium]